MLIKTGMKKDNNGLISGQIYNTHNVTQSTKGDKDGKWTTVFAAAVLLV